MNTEISRRLFAAADYAAVDVRFHKNALRSAGASKPIVEALEHVLDYLQKVTVAYSKQLGQEEEVLAFAQAELDKHDWDGQLVDSQE
jgi:hypothetical protein